MFFFNTERNGFPKREVEKVDMITFKRLANGHISRQGMIGLS